MLAILIKFLIPVVAFYFLQKWLRQTLLISGSGKNNFPKQARTSRRQEDVIEICPECGNVMQENHRCQYKA